MDSLTFVAALTKALAWPAFACVALFALRRELRILVPLITKLKYKDFEVTFSRDAAEARAEAADLPRSAGRALAAAPDVSEPVRLLLGVSPRAAVLEAFRELEESARHAAVRREVMVVHPYSMSLPRLITALGAFHVLDAQQIGLFHDLRALRNEAAHAPEFVLPEAAARNFVEAAARLAEYLRSP